jgi:hypothetical protein
LVEASTLRIEGDGDMFVEVDGFELGGRDGNGWLDEDYVEVSV